MKKTFSLLLLIICSLTYNSFFAQEIAIPFRDGNKWGLVNEKGTLLIEPKFDSYKFTESYTNNHDYIITTTNGYNGLIINGKEILETKYIFISESNNLFTVKSNENGSQMDIITPDGTSVFKKPVATILHSGRIGAYYLYQVLNYDLTESMFVLDVKKRKIIQWLYEDYYSVNKFGEQRYIEEYTFNVKKKQNGEVVQETWDLSKFPFEKIEPKIKYGTEKDYMVYFYEQSAKNKSYRSDNNTEVVEDYSYNGSSGRDYAVEAVDEVSSGYINRRNSNNSSVNKLFKIVDSKLVLVSYMKNNQSDKTEKVIPTVNFKETFIKTHFYNVKNNDTIQNYQNYVTYKKDNKMGVILASNPKQIIEFDTILPYLRDLREGNYIKEVVLQVGKRQKDNSFKYGFYSSERKLITDFIFDELTIVPVPSDKGNTTFISRIGKLFGMIQINGNVIAETKYDEIKQILYPKNTYNKLFQVKLKDKYGLIIQKNYELQFVPTIFDYEIKDVIVQFPNNTNREISGIPKEKKSIMLIELKDKNNEFLGFANVNGTLYFKN